MIGYCYIRKVDDGEIEIILFVIKLDLSFASALTFSWILLIDCCEREISNQLCQGHKWKFENVDSQYAFFVNMETK
jgi:hypothetical protein